MAYLQQQTCLPPSCQGQPQRGYLNLTPLTLTLFKTQTSPSILRIRFWGSPPPGHNYLRLNTTQNFPIVASLPNFKQYLIDSKIAQIQVVDSRNYKIVGYAYLNWVMYMRPIDEKQLYLEQKRGEEEGGEQESRPYYLPFFDEEMEETLPLYKNGGQAKIRSNQKIGEVTLRWSSRIYNQSQPKNTNISLIQSQQNLYNIRMSTNNNKGTFLRFQSQPVSICQIDMVQQQMPSIHDKQQQSKVSINPSYYNLDRANKDRASNLSSNTKFGDMNNKKKGASVTYKDIRPSVFSNKQQPKQDIKKYLQQPQSRVKDSNLDAELIRIRMEMSDYVSEQQQKQKLNQDKVLKIVHFEPATKHLQAKDLSYLDIVIESKEQKNKYRIFPENIKQSKAMFNSALGVGQGAIFNVIASLKKNKELVAKGQTSVQNIREGKDLHIVLGDGTLCGFLRLKTVVSPSQTSVSPPNNALVPVNKEQTLEPMRGKNIDLQQEFKRNFETQILKSRNQQQRLPEKQIQRSQIYFLVLMQEPSNVACLSYKVLGRTLQGSQKIKFAIWPQKQLIRKNLDISIYEKDLFICEERLLDRIKQVNPSGFNLTCSLLMKKIVSNHKVTCSLYAGTVQQLVFFIQELTRTLLSQTVKQKNHHQPQPQYSRNTTEQQQQAESIPRKLKTEEAVRIDTRQRMMTEERAEGESLNTHELELPQQEQEGQGEENDNQNFYLVDLLTRFLEELTSQTLPQQTQIEAQNFIKFLQNQQKQSDLQPQVIEMIISIFQDEVGAPVNLTLIRQSLKAFQTFLGLYSEQSKKTINQLLELQPKAAQKIKNSAELGMINQNILWKKALKKISQKQLQQKINKKYRISSFGPTQAILLLQDLQSLQKTKLRSIDICNLGTLVKEWVQQFLTQIQKDVMFRIKQKINGIAQDNSLNIRTVNLIFESELSLRLSLWQSLMLIQQLKTAYICDIDIGEGIITSDSLIAWIQQVLNRSQVHINKSQLTQSKHSADLREIQEGWSRVQKKINKSKVASKYGEESQIENKNNDSDIVDIGNLLRLREEEEERKFSKKQIVDIVKVEIQKQMSVKQGNKSEIANHSDILEAPLKKSNLNEPKRPLKPQPKKAGLSIFYLSVQQLKINQLNSSSAVLKLSINVGDQDEKYNKCNFLYLTSFNNYEEANGKTFQIKNKQSKSDTIYLRLTEEGQVIGTSVLDWEEYLEWYNEQNDTCRKTLVVYGNRGKIIGKITVNLSKADPDHHHDKGQNAERNYERLKFKIVEATPYISPEHIFNIKVGEVQQQAMIGQQLDLLIQKPIYARQIIILNETKQQSCLILLEELYLRKYLSSQYPLVNTITGNFQTNLFIEMAIEGRPLGQKHNQSHHEESKVQKVQEKIQIQPVKKDTKKVVKPNLASKIKELKGDELLKQIDTIYDSLKAKYDQ